MASSPDTAANPQTSNKSTSPGSTTSNRRRRGRGGPGGPVPVTNTTGNPLHIDMSGLRISDTTSISGHSEAPSSSAGTTSSGRRRRRRRNNNNNKQTSLAKVENAGGSGFSGLPPIPSSSKSKKKGEKSAKLNIGLNLDVDLELKAKIGGDISLSLVVEDKVKRRDCPELPFPGEGEYIATELFYMHVGTLRLRRRWIDPDALLRGQILLTAFSSLLLLLSGFALGWVAARWSLPPHASSAFGLDEYGYVGGHIETSSWVESIAFGNNAGGGDSPGTGSGVAGGGGCDCMSSCPCP